VCQSSQTIKKGKKRGIQSYQCVACQRYFSNARREKTTLEKKLWNEYVFHKQTIRELHEEYHLDKRTIKKHLEAYTTPEKKHHPRHIHLVVDAVYLGERKHDTSWCAVVFRDPHEKENLWWTWHKTETTSIYREGREHLESLGYVILSVTGDGFGGIRQAFSGIPFQMCHVHMERLVIAGTTRRPQTEAGVVLLALVKTLGGTTASIFHKRLLQYIQKYQSFLNEKTRHPVSGEWSFTHAPLRQAVESLLRFQPYLFTYEKYKNIPTTTNSLEGHFSHVRDIVGVHRGITRPHLEKVLHSIFLVSTIAPTSSQTKNLL
jgi:hypothetical protein